MTSNINNDLKEIMIDPTFNVSTLIALHSKRQDDLRIAHEKLGEDQARHLKEIADLRELHSKEIRMVDMANAKSSADALALALSTLSATTTTNADNIRNALNATASTVAKDRNDLAQDIAKQQSIRDENYNKRITTLEQSSYVGQGKDKVSDPLLAGYMGDIKELLLKGAETKGGGLAIQWVITLILAAVAVGGFLMNIITKAAAGGVI